MADMQITLSFPEAVAQRLKALQKMSGHKDNAEVIQYALAVYELLWRP